MSLSNTATLLKGELFCGYKLAAPKKIFGDGK
jgi:hypothetical protein